MYSYLIERMVKELKAILPYPDTFYRTLTKAQIIAIYDQQMKKQDEREKREALKNPKGQTEYYDSTTGCWMVLTDIHGWEPKEN